MCACERACLCVCALVYLCVLACARVLVRETEYDAILGCRDSHVRVVSGPIQSMDLTVDSSVVRIGLRRMRACASARACVCGWVYVCACLRAFVYVCLRACVCMCGCARMHRGACACASAGPEHVHRLGHQCHLAQGHVRRLQGDLVRDTAGHHRAAAGTVLWCGCRLSFAAPGLHHTADYYV